MVDIIVNNLAKEDPFWTETLCQDGKTVVNPYLKFLCMQKMLCYGVSSTAFNYDFQMGETTSRYCLSKLTRTLVRCHELADIYLWKPSQFHARKIVKLHKQVHKIPGMTGYLEVTKVHWRTVPMLSNGSFKEKEKMLG